jgi:hypothetical protein
VRICCIVIVFSFKKYATKLQKVIETESYKIKKVAKRDNISPFDGQISIKMQYDCTDFRFLTGKRHFPNWKVEIIQLAFTKVSM